MTDSEFLTWVADRLVHVHGDPEHIDFVLKLRRMAAVLPQEAGAPEEIIHIDESGRVLAKGWHKSTVLHDPELEGPCVESGAVSAIPKEGVESASLSAETPPPTVRPSPTLGPSRAPSEAAPPETLRHAPDCPCGEIEPHPDKAHKWALGSQGVPEIREAQEAIKFLLKIAPEWKPDGPGGPLKCFSCGGYASSGHKPSCIVDSQFRRARTALGEGSR